MQVLPTIRTHHLELVGMRAEAGEVVIALMMSASLECVALAVRDEINKKGRGSGSKHET
jgi:hypothetical protein